MFLYSHTSHFNIIWFSVFLAWVKKLNRFWKGHISYKPLSKLKFLLFNHLEMVLCWRSLTSLYRLFISATRD